MTNNEVPVHPASAGTSRPKQTIIYLRIIDHLFADY
jgi:hypothetical protein